MKKFLSFLVLVAIFVLPAWTEEDGVCISGNCRDGYGIKAGPEGYLYEGFWRRGKYHGRGKLRHSLTSSYYAGEFRDGVRHGYGEYTDVSFMAGSAEEYTSKYTGQWKDDRMQGKGTMTWRTGKKYAGDFTCGRMEGQGTMTWPDGAKYTGEFREDMPAGRGVLYNGKGEVECRDEVKACLEKIQQHEAGFE